MRREDRVVLTNVRRLAEKRQTRTPFQTLAHTAALVVANVSVASGAALTLNTMTTSAGVRSVWPRKATEAHLGITVCQTYVLTRIELNHTYCRPMRNTPPSSRAKRIAISFCYAPPPLQDLYGKEGFPPSPSGSQWRVGMACLPVCDWREVCLVMHCLVSSGAHNVETRPLKQGCVLTSRVTRR